MGTRISGSQAHGRDYQPVSYWTEKKTQDKHRLNSVGACALKEKGIHTAR